MGCMQSDNKTIPLEINDEYFEKLNRMSKQLYDEIYKSYYDKDDKKYIINAEICRLFVVDNGEKYNELFYKKYFIGIESDEWKFIVKFSFNNLINKGQTMKSNLVKYDLTFIMFLFNNFGYFFACELLNTMVYFINDHDTKNINSKAMRRLIGWFMFITRSTKCKLNEDQHYILFSYAKLFNYGIISHKKVCEQTDKFKINKELF